MIGEVTPRLVAHLKQLLEDGYVGEIKLTNTGATGTANVLDGAMAVELSGFCKETLYIVDHQETEHFILIGRYNQEGTCPHDEMSTRFLTRLAWRFYKNYRPRGYGRPFEWDSLFEKFGFTMTTERSNTYVQELD